ncbi:MAG: tripartite tricarboxylate transporter substrate binding protein [Planctomycetaceae bacterium]
MSTTETHVAHDASRAGVVRRAIPVVLIVALVVWWGWRLVSNDHAAEYPNRPIEVVVPYPAGGGSDTFVRTLQKGFVEDKLLKQPLVVINVAGGGGTIGSRDVRNAAADGYRILCHHNAIITAQLSGAVEYGPEAFEPIALTGSMTMVVIVREDAPYQDLTQLLKAASQNPGQLTFGANVGAPAYFTTLQLERAMPGAEFSIVSADGGADRYARIRGGHLTAGIFSLSEYLDFRSAEGTPPDENIRAIAVLGPHRHPAIPDVPTAIEQNIPVLLRNANYWWAPRGTPSSVIRTLAAALKAAMQNERVKADLTRLRIDMEYSDSDDFQRHLQETTAAFAQATVQPQQSVPDFTKWVGGTVAALFVWVLIDHLLEKNQDQTDAGPTPERVPAGEEFVRRPLTAASCFGVLMLYVFALSQHWLPFAVATTLMVVSIGRLMTGTLQSRWTILIQIALLAGFGTDFLFTEIFRTSLP